MYRGGCIEIQSVQALLLRRPGRHGCTWAQYHCVGALTNCQAGITYLFPIYYLFYFLFYFLYSFLQLPIPISEFRR